MGSCLSEPEVVPQPKPAPRPNHAENFARIRDRFESIEEVQEALRGAGLESSEVIVAVDFTKSNEQTGARSFGGTPLRAIVSTYRVFTQHLQYVSGFLRGICCL